MENSIYEDRIVFYLDILGFRALIERGEAGAILDALQDLERKREIYARPETSSIFALELGLFSDSIIFSCPFNNDNKFWVIANTCLFAAQLAHSLLLRGLLTRGAAHVGDFYQRGNIGFGPALVKAYEAEQKIAYYPRIVIPENVKIWALAHLNPLANLPGVGSNYFFEDADGVICLHILSPYKGLFLAEDGPWRDVALAPLRHLMAEQLAYIKGDARAQSKLQWMNSYINCVDREFGDIVLGDIVSIEK